VALCLGALAGLLPGVAPAEQDPATLYREVFSSPNSAVPGWRCVGQLVVLEAVHRPVRVPLEWTVRAKPFSFHIALRDTEGGKPPFRWWNWAYENGEPTVSLPEGSWSRKGFTGLDRPAWQWTGPPNVGQTPNVSHWLKGMMDLGTSVPDEVRFAGQNNPGQALVVEARWREPIARYFGWTVNRAVIEIDSDRKLPVSVRWYNEGPEPVSETTYADPTQLPSGRWVWLQWKTIIAGPTVHVTGEGTVRLKEPVGKEVRVDPTIEWPKRTVIRTFRVTDEGMVVPRRVEVLGPAGRPALDLVVEKLEQLP
jgi:hypothetical protein